MPDRLRVQTARRANPHRRDTRCVRHVHGQSHRHNRHRRAAFVTAWLTLLCLVTAEPLFAAPGELATFRSRHYTIHSDLRDRETLKTYGQHMDTVFRAFQHRFRDYRPRHDQQMPLYLFRTRDGYQNFLGKHGIDANNSGGMFFVVKDARGLATWTSGRGREAVFEVLQHEGFHQFAWNYLGSDLPIWINEGLAQYFEDGVIVDGRFKTGFADAQRIRLLKDAFASGRGPHVREVLDIDDETWRRTLTTDARASERLYAQAWSVVYFLIHGDGERYRKHLATYLKLVSRKADSRRGNQQAGDAFRAAFRLTDLEPMQRRWSAFAKSQRPDPVTLATDRMAFLAAGMRWMHEQGKPMPEKLDELKQTLQNASFRLIRRSHHGSYELRAQDPTLYGYEMRSTFKPFELLAPSASGLPPRIIAQGLDPEPMVQWRRGDDNELVQTIEYR
ncbi:MAG: DUF1570 domain-containing protein [Phycisphaeraceae bacterium]